MRTIRLHRVDFVMVAFLTGFAVLAPIRAAEVSPPLSSNAAKPWPRAMAVPPTDSFTVPAHFKTTDRAGVLGKTGPARLLGDNGGSWWRLFGDPVLDRLERRAIQGNQDLQQSVARVLDARAQARSVAAGFYPTLDAPLRASRGRSTNTGPISRSRIIGEGLFPPAAAASGSSSLPDSFQGQALTTTSNDFQAQLALGYEVDLFGRIRHSYGRALAQSQASEADRRAVELSLTAQVAAHYFSLRALDSQLSVLRRSARLRADAVQIQEERLKAGLAGDIDLARAQFEVSNTEAELADALQLRMEAENALAVLCGLFASDFHLTEKPLDRSAPPVVPTTLPAQLLSKRPDLIEAERRLAAGTHDIQAAKAEFFPTINLGASAGFQSAEGHQLFKDESHTWAITGGIRIPIFEGGRNAARLDSARAQYDAALAAYRESALIAFREAENALSALRQRALKDQARGRAAECARRVFEIAQKSYQEGAINYFEVIDAQRRFLNAQLLQVQTLNSRYGATIDLIRAFGGGYPPGAATAR